MKFPLSRSGTVAPAAMGSLPPAIIPTGRSAPAVAEAQANRRRFYNAGSNAGFLSWDVQNVSADTAILGHINLIKGRARDLARNNDYVKQFLRLLKSNVVGPNGFRLRVRHFHGEVIDREFSRLVEKHWNIAGKVKNSPSVCGQMSRRELADLWLTTLAIDGEVLEIFYPAYRNKYRFSSKIVDAALIDCTKNGRLPNGNRVKMGVELDEHDRHVAYWLLSNHPGELLFPTNTGPTHQRIPATRARLTYLHEFPGQTRGVSWLASPAVRVQMLQKFEEAIVVASRAAASKGGFYTTSAEYEGTPPGEGEGADGSYDDSQYFRTTVEPGEWTQLPHGVTAIPYDPQFPSAGLQDMAKVMLRGVASGLGASYVMMANNLEGVNYSSIRAGDIEQRSIYRALQQMMIEHHVEPTFDAWVGMLTLKKDSGLPVEHLLRCIEDEEWKFLARGWEWVDPLKEVQAHKEAIKLRLTTRGKVIAQTTGEDIEDVLDEAQEEERMMEDRGMDPRIDVMVQAVDQGGKAPKKKGNPSDETEEEPEDGDEED